MLAEIIEEPKQTVEEVIEDEGELCFDETSENSDDCFLSSSSGYSGMQQEEEKKKYVNEIIEVSKEMDEENQVNITDKAVMAQFKEEEKRFETEKKDESISEKD
ncbi:hypothetical protein Hanom_Chr14g01253721 [Helianthus anomalus]